MPTTQGEAGGDAIDVLLLQSPDSVILPTRPTNSLVGMSGRDKPLSGAMLRPKTRHLHLGDTPPPVYGDNNNRSGMGGSTPKTFLLKGMSRVDKTPTQTDLLRQEAASEKQLQRREGEEKLRRYGTTWTDDPNALTDREDGPEEDWGPWIIKQMIPQILVAGAILYTMAILRGDQVKLTGVVHRVREVKTRENGPTGAGVGRSRPAERDAEPGQERAPPPVQQQEQNEEGTDSETEAFLAVNPFWENRRAMEEERRLMRERWEPLPYDEPYFHQRRRTHVEVPDETDSEVTSIDTEDEPADNPFWEGRNAMMEERRLMLEDSRQRFKKTVVMSQWRRIPPEVLEIIMSYHPVREFLSHVERMKRLGYAEDGENFESEEEDWKSEDEEQWVNPEATSSNQTPGPLQTEPPRGSVAPAPTEQPEQTTPPLMLGWTHQWSQPLTRPWSREIQRWDEGGRPLRQVETDVYRQSLQAMGVNVVHREARVHHVACWVQAIMCATPGISSRALEQLAGLNYPTAVDQIQMGEIIDLLGLDITVMLMYYAWTDRSDVNHGSLGVPEGAFHVTQAECLRRARQFRGAAMFATTRAGTVGSRVIVLCMAPNGPVGHYVALERDGLNLYNTQMPPALIPVRQFAAEYARLVDQVVDPATGDVIGFQERGGPDGEENGDLCNCCLEHVDRNRVECRVCHTAWHVWCYQQLLSTQPQFRHSFRSDLVVCVNCRARSAVTTTPMQPPPPPLSGGPWGGPDHEVYPEPDGDQPGAPVTFVDLPPMALPETPTPQAAATAAGSAHTAGESRDAPRDSDEHLNLLVMRQVRDLQPPAPNGT